MSAVLCKTALHSTTWIPIDFYLVAFSSVFSTKLCLASISINKLSGYVSHSPLSSWLINTFYLLQTWSFRFQTIFFSFETLFIVLHFSPSYRKKSQIKIAIGPRLTKIYFMIKAKISCHTEGFSPLLIYFSCFLLMQDTSDSLDPVSLFSQSFLPSQSLLPYSFDPVMSPETFFFATVIHTSHSTKSVKLHFCLAAS